MVCGLCVHYRSLWACLTLLMDDIPFHNPDRPFVMHCIYNGNAMFDWDKNNLRKIRSHRIKAEEVERALSNDPIPIYEQDVDGEMR
jgi:hypothetical protein